MVAWRTIVPFLLLACILAAGCGSPAETPRTSPGTTATTAATTTQPATTSGIPPPPTDTDAPPGPGGGPSPTPTPASLIPFAPAVHLTSAAVPFAREASLAVGPDGTTLLVCAPTHAKPAKPFYISKDNGTTWTATDAVSSPVDPRALMTRQNFDCDVAIDAGGTLYIAEMDDTAHGTTVTVAASTDKGATWPVVNALASGANSGPAIYRPWLTAGAAGTVHLDFVSWNGNATNPKSELRYARSDTGGAAFKPPVTVLATPVGTHITPGAVAASADGKQLAIPFALTSSSGNTVHAAYSGDSGATWSDVQVADSWSFGYPSMARDAGGLLHMVWNQWNTTAWSLQYATSSDDGATWSAPIILHPDPEAAYPLKACIAGGAKGQAAIAFYNGYRLHWMRLTGSNQAAGPQVTAGTTTTDWLGGWGWPEYTTVRIDGHGMMRMAAALPVDQPSGGDWTYSLVYQAQSGGPAT